MVSSLLTTKVPWPFTRCGTLRSLDRCQLADLPEAIRLRVLGYLERQGVG